MGRVLLLCTLGVLMAAVFATSALSASVITHQGYLSNDQGVPLPGPVNLTFGIFAAATGGSPLWSETHSSVALSNGSYTVLLGSVTAFPADLFASDSLWIQTSVDGTQMPRVIIGEVPRAIHAERAVVADSLAGFSGGVPGQYWDAVGATIHNTNSGNVGVGTANPSAKLEVNGNAWVSREVNIKPNGTDNTACIYISQPNRLANWGIGAFQDFGGTNNDLKFLRFFNNSFADIPLQIQQSTGNVGIGTSNPTSRLQVEGESTFHRDDWGNPTILLRGQKSGPPNNWGEYALVAAYQGLDVTNPQTAATLLHLGAGGGGSANSFINVAGGNFGIGTNSPSEKLTVAGNIRQTDGNINTTGTLNTTVGITTDWIEQRGLQPYIDFHWNNTTTDYNTRIINDQDGKLSMDAPLTYMTGTASVRTLEIRGGADLAEPFAVHKGEAGNPADAGMVVRIDDEAPGHLRVSTTAYDRRVAGVISGANGLAPGVVLKGAGPDNAEDLPVALSGRVWCMCDASAGAIRPGDLLTTGDRPGHAMKAQDRDRAQGATLGKAMTALESGQGMVLVLVTLQ
jgi:hypothetical protein